MRVKLSVLLMVLIILAGCSDGEIKIELPEANQDELGANGSDPVVEPEEIVEPEDVVDQDVLLYGDLLMTYTKSEIEEVFGQPDSVIESHALIEYYYEEIPYSITFLQDELSDQSVVAAINVHGDGTIDGITEFIGRPYQEISDMYEFIIYEEKSFAFGGNPTLSLKGDVYNYVILIDSDETCMGAMIVKNDIDKFKDTRAADYVDMTIGQLKDTYGGCFLVEELEPVYIISYTGGPFGFVLSKDEPLTDQSIIKEVTIIGIGNSIYDDGLSLMTQETFNTSGKDLYTIHKQDMNTYFLEADGFFLKVDFHAPEGLNQIRVGNDKSDVGLYTEPSRYGEDYLGLTYGQLIDILGKPTGIDISKPAFMIIQFNEYTPFMFGYDVSQELTMDTIITEMVVLDDRGGYYIEGYNNSDLTYDNIVDVLANDFYNFASNTNEQGARLVFFESDTIEYTGYYTDQDYPGLMTMSLK